MAGARHGVELRSQAVKSTVERARASQAGRRPKQILKRASKGRLGTTESVELVWLSMVKQGSWDMFFRNFNKKSVSGLKRPLPITWALTEEMFHPAVGYS